MTVTILLPGCRSLKERRQRIGGLHERLGRQPAVAVCESGERQRPEHSEWSFAVVGRARRDVETIWRQIEDKLVESVDGRIVDVQREWC